MKTLAKYHVCNRCVIGEKTFKNILTGTVSYRDFRETGPWCYLSDNVSVQLAFDNVPFAANGHTVQNPSC